MTGGRPHNNRRVWNQAAFSHLLAEPVRNGVYKPKGFHGTGVKMVNMGELFAYDFISDQEMRRLELTHQEMEKSSLQKGDLLFARRSLVLEGSGKSSIVMQIPEPTTFESSIIRARLDRSKADPLFYFYFFKSPRGRATVLSIATRTAVSGIRGSDLMQLSVDHPPLNIQAKVARILYNYDLLVQNNLHRIRILEDSARTIFREWFVKFQFPGHGKARLVDTPAGKIPDSWTFDRLDRLMEIRKGRQPRELTESRKDGQLPYLLIDVLKGGTPRYASPDGAIACAQEHTLMVMDGASSGLVFTGYAGIVGSTLAAISPIGAIAGANNYLFLLLQSRFQEIRAKNIGAAIPHANKDYLQQVSVAVPRRDILDQFERIAMEISSLVVALKRKNEFLQHSRDLLLPRLISGELDVSDLDIKVEDDKL